jgi:hypothetical protein
VFPTFPPNLCPVPFSFVQKRLAPSISQVGEKPLFYRVFIDIPADGEVAEWSKALPC